VISVRTVEGRAGWAAFARVRRVVYRDDPYWIPDEVADIGALLINPSPCVAQRMQSQAFVAYDGKTPVGRVVAIADRVYIEHHHDRTAFFGFYEAVDQEDVALALLDAASQWARERALTSICGPVSPTMLYSAGMLVSGFGQPPLVGMAHNPDYYAQHAERCGMHKIIDFYSYLIPDPYGVLHSEQFARQRRLHERWRPHSKVTFRSLDWQHFEDDVDIVRQIYNAAFSTHWGFAPLDAEEMLGLAKSMRSILDNDLIVFAELDHKPVGFLMAIPDVNQAIAKAARWHNPLARNLITQWYWKGPGRHRLRRHLRLDMLVVHPDCPDPGTAGLLLVETLSRIHQKGYTSVEGAPVLEDGSWIGPIKTTLGLQPHRVYRVYGRQLEPATSANDQPAMEDRS
jgi:hypothetical protein